MHRSDGCINKPSQDSILYPHLRPRSWTLTVVDRRVILAMPAKSTETYQAMMHTTDNQQQVHSELEILLARRSYAIRTRRSRGIIRTCRSPPLLLREPLSFWRAPRDRRKGTAHYMHPTKTGMSIGWLIDRWLSYVWGHTDQNFKLCKQ